MSRVEGQEPERRHEQGAVPQAHAPADQDPEAGLRAVAAVEPERRVTTEPEGFGALRGAWDYASLAANVRLGRECWLERRDSFGRILSRRDPALILGERVRVHTWTTFNIEDDGLVEIGDDCVLVGPVFMCTERIRLGRRVLISYQVTLADSDFHPLQPELRELDALAIAPSGDRSRRQPFQRAPIEIGDDVQIGIGALILKGVHIGAGARIGPGAVVTRDVPAGAVMIGNPARPEA